MAKLKHKSKIQFGSKDHKRLINMVKKALDIVKILIEQDSLYYMVFVTQMNEIVTGDEIERRKSNAKRKSRKKETSRP